MKMKNWIATAATAVAALMGGQASATVVGLELILLTDVSGSVDTNEYDLQKMGYVNAFRSSGVQTAITNSQGGGIAVAYYEWSGQGQFSTRVNWTLINSAASANAFANALQGTSRAFSGTTALQSALNDAYRLFGTETGGTANSFESTRQVIDVSGDGANNDGLSGTVGRDAALAAGVDTINGIYIGNESGLKAHYENFVIGGSNAFAMQAATFADFDAAIQQKLIREIVTPPTDVPEPASLALIGLGLVGVAASRRRKQV